MAREREGATYTVNQMFAITGRAREVAHDAYRPPFSLVPPFVAT